jgi:hypothetical protein
MSDRTLVLPRVPFWRRDTAWQPPEPAPTPPDPRHMAMLAAAQALADAAAALLDPALVEAAKAAYQASVAASDALRVAQAELAALGPAEETDTAEVGARIIQRLVLQEQIPIFQRRADRMGDLAIQAIAAVRNQLDMLSRPSVEQLREKNRTRRAEIEALEQQIGDTTMAIHQMRSIHGRWLPSVE